MGKLFVRESPDIRIRLSPTIRNSAHSVILSAVTVELENLSGQNNQSEVTVMKQKTFEQNQGTRFFSGRRGKYSVPGAGCIPLLTWSPIRETDTRTGEPRQEIPLHCPFEIVCVVPIQQLEG
jgi:hypothetical protein